MTTDVDLLVVGAGFAGLYQVHRARQMGLTVVAVEAGSDVGGTWFWNRYPGARCDVESLEYSYSFDADLQEEWRWTERYAAQPEILRYLEHVADRFDLRRSICFGTRVVSATYDEETRWWDVRTDRGVTYRARVVVMATGCLSAAKVPELPGAETFRGCQLHTGRWPHDGVDLTGLRVGVVGTGSSGIQAIPVIAGQAAHVTVFQRTPAYAVPARNAPLDPAVERAVKDDYAAFRAANARTPNAGGARYPAGTGSALAVTEAERRAEYEMRWQRGGFSFLAAYSDLLTDTEANATAADFIRDKIRGIVADPEVAAHLLPDQVVGCKRICVDTGYYETYNRPNVTLVDLRDNPIVEVTPAGIRTAAAEHELDCIVYATGFDAMTGALSRIDIRGRGGQALADAWSAGPRTYLGLGVAGFPNLFLVTGPGSPSVLTNMVVAIEQHVDWVSDCLAHLRAEGLTTIEPTPEAQDAWVDHVNSVADRTLYPTCNSWYLGANVPGKPRVFMPLPDFAAYADHCAEVVADGYRGFTLS